MTSAWALSLGCGVLEGEATDGPVEGLAPVVHEGRNEAALTRVRTCDDVLEQIQASTIARLVERAEQLRQPPEYYYGEPGIVVDDGNMVTPPDPPARRGPSSLRQSPGQ